jgi:biopolymer transport protein ExbD
LVTLAKAKAMRKTKLKLNRNLSIDMAGLCDVAFLILVFFISVSHFDQWEPLKVQTPTARGNNVCTAFRPDANAIIYIADKEVMFQFAGCDSARKLALSGMAKKYGVAFSPDEQVTFLGSPITGASISQLKLYDDQYHEWDAPVNRPGIPYAGENSELYNWILEARKAEVAVNNRALLITIKADKHVSYPVIKNVIHILQKQKVNKFNLMIDSKSSTI